MYEKYRRLVLYLLFICIVLYIYMYLFYLYVLFYWFIGKYYVARSMLRHFAMSQRFYDCENFDFIQF